MYQQTEIQGSGFIHKASYFILHTVADGVWRSQVARTAGGREVAGSNPATPTTSDGW